jgi:two-component sensor histidine kinase
MQLRENPQIRDDILGRLHALSATDGLIEEAQGQGAYMRDIAVAELGPYVASRAAIAGADIILPPKMAVTMALLVHELATNSAKYGALSAPEGRVSMHWSLSGAVLNVEWRESGGPAVKAPTHRGFGLRLLTGALDRFGGSVEMNFEPTGLVCKMRLELRENGRIAPDGSGADDQPSA